VRRLDVEGLLDLREGGHIEMEKNHCWDQQSE
jgi:hypothetical protein